MKKNFEIRTLIKSYWLNIDFSRNCPKFLHIYKNRNFTSIIVIFKTNCLYPINSMAVAWEEYFFFNFASCEPLKRRNVTLFYKRWSTWAFCAFIDFVRFQRVHLKWYRVPLFIKFGKKTRQNHYMPFSPCNIWHF